MFSSVKRRREEPPYKLDACNVCNGRDFVDTFFGGGASKKCNENRKDNLEDGELECADCLGFAKEVENIGNYGCERRKEEVVKEKVMEKTRVSDTYLLSQSTYFLNKSCSKWLCIGLDAELFFEPTIKIGGIKKQYVTFTEQEWLIFLMWEMDLRKYFKDNTLVFQVMESTGIGLSFECFDGINKILKIEKDGQCVYLSYEGMYQVWKLVELLRCRMENLKELKYVKFYKEFINSLTGVQGELTTEMEKLLDRKVGENICITRELMLLDINKIVCDVKLCRTSRE